MQLRLWFLVVLLLASARHLAAQDSLAFSANPLVLTQPSTISASDMARWRLSGYVGYTINPQPDYRELYLTRGMHASLAADYFFNRNLGLGMLLGYQNLAVSDAYRNDPSIPVAPVIPRVFPLTSLHSFVLAVGPALSFPLGNRLSFNVELRGGLFYNDAPVLGSYSLGGGQDESLTGRVETYISSNDQRGRWGAIAFAGLQYQLTPQVSMGVAANSSVSSFGYNQIGQSGYFNQYRVSLNTFGVQASVAYRFSPVRRQAKTVQSPVVPMPVCYAPILDVTQPSLYEVGAGSRPLFRWRSGSPVYTEDEQYVFRLYTLPGNKLIYEKTTKDMQVAWPAQVILPDSSSYFYYALYTSRTDELERTCRSEPVVGTKGFYLRTAADKKPAVPRETVIEYSRKLYELRSVPIAKPDSQAIAKVVKPAPRRRGAPAARPVPVPVPDSIRLGIRIVPTLVYEGVSQQADFTWPDSLATPAEPTIYQYVVGRTNSRTSPTQIRYLIVEPDGCTSFISEATKNRYLQYHTTTDESTTPATEPPSTPTDKGR
jgi:hypothetical protein